MKGDTDVDPRIKRTKDLLFEALGNLLHDNSFNDITMGDIADRSTVNRATIYTHFRDKIALLEAMVHDSFTTKFRTRMDGLGGGCQEGMRQLILVVCDFLGGECFHKHPHPFPTLVETTVRKVVRGFLADGLRHEPSPWSEEEINLRATIGSWAICGAVQEWTRERGKSPEELAEALLPLVRPNLIHAEGLTPR